MDGPEMVIVTPGSRAPVVSVIFPFIAPVVALTVCPDAAHTEPNISPTTSAEIRRCTRLIRLLRPCETEGRDAVIVSRPTIGQIL
jgi:hypothetical protein